jgi:hypothetical protein
MVEGYFHEEDEGLRHSGFYGEDLTTLPARRPNLPHVEVVKTPVVQRLLI